MNPSEAFDFIMGKIERGEDFDANHVALVSMGSKDSSLICQQRMYFKLEQFVFKRGYEAVMSVVNKSGKLVYRKKGE